MLEPSEITMNWFGRAIHLLQESPAVGRIIDRVLKHRQLVIVCIHVGLFAASYGLALAMLHEYLSVLEVELAALQAMVPLIVIRLAVFWRHDLFQGLWRYVSFPDLLNIVRASSIGTLLFSLLGVVFPPLRMPERIYLLDLALCVLFTGGVRFMVRHLRESYLPGDGRKHANRLLLVGPLARVQPLVKEMIGDRHVPFTPVAVVDPTGEHEGGHIRVSDVPVYALPEVRRRWSRLREVQAVVLCWPGASRKELDGVVEALTPLQAPFKTLPHVEDILSGKVSISDIRNVEIEDLLERPPVHTDLEQIRHHLHGRAVLVTGGGGSIGSELCRQVAALEPRRLVIVERSESSLHDLLLELEKTFPALPLHASISSINDFRGLLSLMRESEVEVVFHAAAYKHVPLMEAAPIESAYNNIVGTYNVAKAAAAAGVKRLLMISSDKAVNPTNVMGATKRIAEMVVRSYDGRAGTRSMTVRFGNVLGSAGSVIPIFKRQIAEGGPVTVTHPQMERYFMTIPEAVQLILQAACLGDGGEVFVLDMGRPVKILHLAEKLITLSGKRPYEEIEIRFTQVRPGEKLFEELFESGEKRLPTAHPRIIKAVSTPVDPRLMEREIDEIGKLIRRRDERGLLGRFASLVPGYRCPGGAAPQPAQGEPPVSGALPLLSRERGLQAPQGTC